MNRKSEIRITGRSDGRIYISLSKQDPRASILRSITGSRWHPETGQWSLPANARKALLKLYPKARWDVGDRSAGRPRNNIPRRDVRSSGRVQDILARSERELRLKRYSHRTRKRYLSIQRAFLDYVSTPPTVTDCEKIRDFVHDRVTSRSLGFSSHSQTVSAIRFLYRRVFQTPLVDLDLPYPKKERRLPRVLPRISVLNLLGAIKNEKHRALFALAYGSGLRVSELVALRVQDLQPERDTLFVKGGKAKKTATHSIQAWLQRWSKLTWPHTNPEPGSSRASVRADILPLGAPRKWWRKQRKRFAWLTTPHLTH